MIVSQLRVKILNLTNNNIAMTPQMMMITQMINFTIMGLHALLAAN